MRRCRRVPLAVRLALLALVPASASRGEREPVLKQIDEPHAYYYREMYLPQVTSGPSTPSWSPDGTELAFASDITGEYAIYRQRLSDGQAWRVTFGPGPARNPDYRPGASGLRPGP